MGRRDFLRPGSTLLLCLFSPSPSSSTSSPLLTILHIPAPFMFCLLQEPLNPAPREPSILHLRPPCPALFYISLVPTMIHSFHQYNHLLSAYHMLGIELGALHILPHFLSMRAIKVAIITLSLNVRKSRLREVQ